MPVGKAKDTNPFGHLYSHHDPDNVDTVSWTYEGTCYPYGMRPDSTPGQAGEAELASREPVSTVLYDPLAIPASLRLGHRSDLTDREELSRALEDAPDASAYMAVRAVGTGPVFGSEVRIDVSEGEQGLEKGFGV